MGMNMMNENDYLVCPKCGHKLFREENVYSLKKMQTSEGDKIKQDKVNTLYYCTKCGESMTAVIGQTEIVK